MLRSDSSIAMLILAALVAIGVGYYVPKTFSVRPGDEAKAAEGASDRAKTITPAVAGKSSWVASAPGRVEPAGGEVKIGAQAPGRVAEVLVALNDKVVAGDLLLRLDDEELQARVLAAAAEASVRKRERDTGDAAPGNQARDRRTAEDNLSSAERQLYQAREELDRALRARQANPSGDAADVDKARDGAAKARERVDQTRAALRKALAADGLPAPSRLEVALAAARADLSLAEMALERSRVRASATGTVLQLNTRVGEIVAPSPEAPLVLLGNVGTLRIRAEFEERDLTKVRVGQSAVVRSDAFPGKDFEGKIATLAQALTPTRLGQRGPRRPTDVDVLEVLINLTGQPPLLPGMRVDVFLKADGVAQPGGPTPTNSASAN
jgi:HlyD family secretion protein